MVVVDFGGSTQKTAVNPLLTPCGEGFIYVRRLVPTSPARRRREGPGPPGLSSVVLVSAPRRPQELLQQRAGGA